MKTIEKATQNLKYSQLYRTGMIAKAQQELQEAKDRQKWQIMYGNKIP